MNELSTEFYFVAVVATTILSAARLARLAVIDKFPPVKAVRTWYENKTDGSDWQWLALCVFCFAPWATLLVGAWGWLAGVYGNSPMIEGNPSALIWWAFNGWLAMSYLAASYVARDGAVGEDD